eukprot:1066360_1
MIKYPYITKKQTNITSHRQEYHVSLLLSAQTLINPSRYSTQLYCHHVIQMFPFHQRMHVDVIVAVLQLLQYFAHLFHEIFDIKTEFIYLHGFIGYFLKHINDCEHRSGAWMLPWFGLRFGFT